VNGAANLLERLRRAMLRHAGRKGVKGTYKSRRRRERAMKRLQGAKTLPERAENVPGAFRVSRFLICSVFE